MCVCDCRLTVPTRLIAQVKQWLAIAAFLASIGHKGSLWRRRNITVEANSNR